jgi:hypothetical protein
MNGSLQSQGHVKREPRRREIEREREREREWERESQDSEKDVWVLLTFSTNVDAAGLGQLSWLGQPVYKCGCAASVARGAALSFFFCLVVFLSCKLVIDRAQKATNMPPIGENCPCCSSYPLLPSSCVLLWFLWYHTEKGFLYVLSI